jgi:hypothetical protein
MEFLEVTSNNRETILELFSKDLDKDGFIIEKKTGKRITCPYSNKEVHSDSFSILPGSAIFVNNYAYCFAEHITTHS